MPPVKPLFVAAVLCGVLAVLGLPGTYAQLSCSLDLFSLTVEDSEVTFFLHNTGAQAATVSYAGTINGEAWFSGNATINASQTVEAGYTITFEPGTFAIRVSASSSCGASDSETIEHTILPTPVCSSPVGLAGQDRCEPQTQSYFLCEDGDWTVKAQNTLLYCNACRLSTCGDGALNCGETERTCPRDALLQPCQTGFSGSFRCEGQLLQREFVTSACARTFVTVEKCAEACLGHSCFPPSGPQPGCALELRSFDYLTELPPGQPGTATFTLKNTGSLGTLAAVKLLLDGALQQAPSFTLFAGQEISRTLIYTPPAPGQHTLALEAAANCGARAGRTVTVFVPTGPAVSPALFFTSAPAPQPTRVAAVPTVLDIRPGEAKAVSITIEPARPQAFRLAVTGLPADWLTYERAFTVSQRETHSLTIVPAASGFARGELTVTALGDGRNFTFPLEIFVAGQGLFTGELVIPGFAELAGGLAAVLIALVILYTFRDDLRFRLLELKWRRFLRHHRVLQIQ